ncbi:three-finger toxin 3FTx-Oxy6-like [Portunus trituberculatus]|uniref:three-finger toxin 3FTx-Oxy6-like n=1 Tax=Portunus trituberculatus TaxID=210409 RepID=UPI001E1CB2E3|nr:three-finger toxin 3FTx-Oxy6-like [Portunus trituberculatus]
MNYKTVMKGFGVAAVVLAAASLTAGLKCWQCTDCDLNKQEVAVCEPNENICLSYRMHNGVMVKDCDVAPSCASAMGVMKEVICCNTDMCNSGSSRGMVVMLPLLVLGVTAAFLHSTN